MFAKSAEIALEDARRLHASPQEINKHMSQAVFEDYRSTIDSPEQFINEVFSVNRFALSRKASQKGHFVATPTVATGEMAFQCRSQSQCGGRAVAPTE